MLFDSFSEVYPTPPGKMTITEESAERIVKRGKTADGSDLMGQFAPSSDLLEYYSLPKEDVIETCSFESETCSLESVTFLKGHKMFYA